MHTFYATAMSNGQVWLPVELRRQLGIKPYTQVEFTVENGVATLKPLEFQLEDIIGSLPPLPAGVAHCYDEIRAIAIEDAVEERLRKLAAE